MNSLELAENFHKWIENQEWDKVADCLTEDFVFTGPMPEPLNKEQFLGAHKAMLPAFTDFNYNCRDLRQEGDSVFGKISITAKHTGTLDLSFSNGPVLEATNKEIAMGIDEFETVIRDNKICKIESIPQEGGGMDGLIKAITAEEAVGA